MSRKVEIKKSLLKDTDMDGLFAKREFKVTIPPTVICNYDGVKVHKDVYTQPDYNRDYVMGLDKDYAIDAIDPYSSLGRYINDPIYKKKANCRLSIKRNKTMVIIPTKNIQIGDELYLSYGDFYWQDVDKFDRLSSEHQQYLYNNAGDELLEYLDYYYEMVNT